MSIDNTKKQSTSQQGLMMAIYGSFAVGAFLLMAIFFREFKKQKLRLKGIHPFRVSCLRKLQLYRYKDFVLPDFVVNNLDDIQSFEGRPEDIWVVSFPRSGESCYLHH